MKTCITCKTDKLVSEFSKNSTKRDGLSSSCKSCMKVFRKNHYDKNKEKITAEVIERREKIKADSVEKLRLYLSNKSCADCFNTDIRVLEFDHLRDKTANISLMVCAGYLWDSILKEIEKCEVVCKNCHGIRTALRGGHFRSLWI